MEWRAKKHDLPPKLFDGMRASYPGVREREEGRMEGREKVWPSCLMWLMSLGNVSPLPQVQLQDNSSDCGVFVLQYVESLLKVSLPPTKPRSASVETCHSFSSPSLSICCRVSKRTGPSPPPQTLGPVIRRRTASEQLSRV